MSGRINADQLTVLHQISPPPPPDAVNATLQCHLQPDSTHNRCKKSNSIVSKFSNNTPASKGRLAMWAFRQCPQRAGQLAKNGPLDWMKNVELKKLFRKTRYSLVSFLSTVLLLTLPPCQDILKSGEGGTCPFPCEVGATALKAFRVSMVSCTSF